MIYNNSLDEKYMQTLRMNMYQLMVSRERLIRRRRKLIEDMPFPGYVDYIIDSVINTDLHNINKLINETEALIELIDIEIDKMKTLKIA